MKIQGLLHKFSAQVPIFGQIRAKTTNLTPDLGCTGHHRNPSLSPYPWVPLP
jgi:hypothetical protein